MKTYSWLTLLSYGFLFACTTNPEFTQADLGQRTATLLDVDGYQFKDLNKNGTLDPYEDWRLSVDQRTDNLIAQMTLEEKVGFMLISTTRLAGDFAFQPGAPRGEITSGFNEEDLIQPNNMFTRQPLATPLMSASGTTKGVIERHLRHFILRANTNAKIMAEWSNNLQALCEDTRLGIPAIVASNPRNHITMDAAIGLSQGATVFSKWPGELGLSATQDLGLIRKFADIARQEWASVGIRKGYQYMADLATEPRWQRNEGTFGEDADWAAAVMREVVLGFQGEKLGKGSVALTTKHFPGGGPQVEGQDPHFDFGKDQHYPGGMFDYHLKPFQAAIDAGTSAIMPYYAKPIGTEYEEVAFAYNKRIIKDLLRDKMGFQGIINSDTGPIEMQPWGMEKYSIEERYGKALEAGVDLFSGTGDPTQLMAAVTMGYVTEKRINESIVRLLKEKFELGLFENPYVDVEQAKNLVGNPEFQEAGDLAMRKSIVLLRNDLQVLPIKAKTKVYFETYFDKGGENAPTTPFTSSNPSWEFELVATQEEADLVVLWLNPHFNSLFSSNGSEIDVRLSKNKIDTDYVNGVLSKKPTVTIINFTNPWVISEIDGAGLQTLVATFGTTPEAILDVLAGKVNPTAKMPFTIPVSAEVVKSNLSDVPGHQETEGYALFKFGHGLSY
ncbi:glycoside hydrolase family 3 N-terminal domain-containing protein [Algoriphagus sp. C2-6-M1]|uniref:glycoside hydrolase family 3 protein n=1 Tax=Algoriphagus persicinus TaxID=3108754 RepID=UPI002B3CD21F|nr:glycoside hydrolase family 3 N-terminal domain-containing protein [Algoriphagus sp. C2-6-M1]MEB2780481.1 glycoside hydrolase family 3 N-terminal domain-containing protein [Algoriphagus sp. C2-6-M1]